MCSGEMDGVEISEILGVRVSTGFQSEIRRGSDGLGRISVLPGDIRGAGPLYSAERKETWPVDQSINGLYCLSQLYPRTAEQEESSDAT